MSYLRLLLALGAIVITTATEDTCTASTCNEEDSVSLLKLATHEIPKRSHRRQPANEDHEHSHHMHEAEEHRYNSHHSHEAEEDRDHGHHKRETKEYKDHGHHREAAEEDIERSHHRQAAEEDSNIAVQPPVGIIELPSTAAGNLSYAPPLFRIKAATLYDAGYQHGLMARDRIHGWFNTTEMSVLFKYIGIEPGDGNAKGQSIKNGAGNITFEQMKRDNGEEFPDYVDEMRGMAKGAGVSLDHIWAANLILEMENLMYGHDKIAAKLSGTPASAEGHCSDVYAIADGGYKNGFAHGHNDDWSKISAQYYYFVSYTLHPVNGGKKPGFTNCGGLAYPGTVFGWAPTWNEHGMWATQNTLVPRKSRTDGLSCTFVQRRAICDARNLDEAIAGLTIPGWSDGASMNVVDVRNRRMANVELWEDAHDVVEVTEAMGNYSHFNGYKHLKKRSGEAIDDPSTYATDTRQATVDAFPPARSAHDIMVRLSDPQVFRPAATISTGVINGSTGQLSFWCCGVTAASAPDTPVHSWNLHNFFDGPQ